MNKFDRNLQKKILEVCFEAYPEHTTWGLFAPTQFDLDITGIDEKTLSANIVYLEEHSLITIQSRTSDDPYSFLDNMRATHKGIDFLLNDGGLSAILNVQTIQFHKETITVLEDLIVISNLSESQKEEAKLKLKDISHDVIKCIIQSITDAGLSILLPK